MSLPRAFDGCMCPCHTQPGITHVMACCGSIPKRRITAEHGLGTQCPKCPNGSLYEKTLQDSWDGTFTCDICDEQYSNKANAISKETTLRYMRNKSTILYLKMQKENARLLQTLKEYNDVCQRIRELEDGN